MKICKICGGKPTTEYAVEYYCAPCLEREKRRNMSCFWEQMPKTIESAEHRNHGDRIGEREIATLKSRTGMLSDIKASIESRRATHARAMAEE